MFTSSGISASCNKSMRSGRTSWPASHRGAGETVRRAPLHVGKALASLPRALEPGTELEAQKIPSEMPRRAVPSPLLGSSCCCCC